MDNFAALSSLSDHDFSCLSGGLCPRRVTLVVTLPFTNNDPLRAGIEARAHARICASLPDCSSLIYRGVLDGHRATIVNNPLSCDVKIARPI